MATEILTRDEVNAFATKLEQWGRSLAPREQALLMDILHLAASFDADDVEGHAALQPVIAAAVLAAAAALGVTELAMPGPSASHHPAAQTATSVNRTVSHSQTIVDDKGGVETIP
jgi:hypothetical protein